LFSHVGGALLPISIGGVDYDWRIDGYRHADEQILTLTYGATGPEPTLVRVHSACVTGDVFGSLRCDCQAQLHAAMQLIAKAGAGLIVYMYDQEGRGIGILNKIRAYALQDKGFDTVDANTNLGLPVDSRRFDGVTSILRHVGVQRIRLMTNNPEKVRQLALSGMPVEERVALIADTHRHRTKYMETKARRMSHLLGDV